MQQYQRVKFTGSLDDLLDLAVRELDAQMIIDNPYGEITKVSPPESQCTKRRITVKFDDVALPWTLYDNMLIT